MQSNCRENFILDFHTTLRYISTVFSVSVRSEEVGERGGCTHSAYSFWLLSSSVPPFILQLHWLVLLRHFPLRNSSMTGWHPRAEI